MWNRLAVVGAALTLTVGPLVFLSLETQTRNHIREVQYLSCQKGLEGIQDWQRRMEMDGVCADLRWPKHETWPIWTWENWRGASFGLGGAYVVLYLLLWGIVATAKWVWAGRRQ